MNPRGRPTRYRFEYGKGRSLNLRTPLVAAGDGTVAVPVAATLSLVPNTAYSYRLVATNSVGTARSGRRTFTTPSECSVLFPSKLSIARASTAGGVIDVFAPITSRASGEATVDYHAAGQHTRFDAAIDSAAGRIRFSRSVSSAQARLGTGILTIVYPGDGDTRAQTVRLRAATNKARLDLARPQIVNGRIRRRARSAAPRAARCACSSATSSAATTGLLEVRGTIAGGRWSIDQPLSPQTLTEMASRVGAVHSYTLFTGYLPARMRGEMRAFQVLGNP